MLLPTLCILDVEISRSVRNVGRDMRYKDKSLVGLEACYGNLEAFSDIFQNLIETQ